MSARYSDAELRGMVATGGRTIPMQQADLAKDLLAARRALRVMRRLVGDAARLGAIDRMYEHRMHDAINDALPPRGARGSRAKGGRKQR